MSTYTGQALRVADRGKASKRIPRPDYQTHPAYGGAFPKPNVALRARAFARFAPWFAFVAAKRLLLFDRLPTLPDYDGPMNGGILRRVAASGRYAPLIARGLLQE